MCLSGGCAANGTGGGSAVMPTTFWYKDVLPITQVRCANCHQAGGIGPFPLQTYAQAKPMAAAMKVAVVAKRMPPWMPDTSCGGPFVDDRSLTQAQIDTISKWVDEGAAEGNPADAPAAPGPVGQLPRIDSTLTMTEPYTPSSTQTDDYRCFLVDPALPLRASSRATTFSRASPPRCTTSSSTSSIALRPARRT
jgi:hypothetical protein